MYHQTDRTLNSLQASNLVIEFHTGGARFEITTVLLFVVKNNIETLFLETGVKIRAVHIIHMCALYTSKYRIRYTIYILRRLKASL